jgi:hypothetical protein
MVNIFISGGSGRERLKWGGQTFTKAELKSHLKQYGIHVFYNGSKPSLKADDRLDYMIAPKGNPSASSQKVLDRHEEAGRAITWDAFVKKHLKSGGNESMGGEEKTPKSNAKSKSKAGGTQKTTNARRTKTANGVNDILGVPPYLLK